VSEEYISGVIQLNPGHKWRGMDHDEELLNKFYDGLKKYKDTCNN